MNRLFSVMRPGTAVRHRLTQESGIVTSAGPFNCNVAVLEEQTVKVLGQWVRGKEVVVKRWPAALCEPCRAPEGVVLGELQ